MPAKRAILNLLFARSLRRARRRWHAAPEQKTAMTFIEFICREQRFGVPLSCVRRALPSALPVPLPGAPAIVSGALNVAGELVIVLDFSVRIGLPPRPLALHQHLLLVALRGMLVAFIVDEVLGIYERAADDSQDLPTPFAGAAYIDGVVRDEDGLCLIVEPDRFLFDGEIAMLRTALESD
jgi:chemotaxis signal transduction protein